MDSLFSVLSQEGTFGCTSGASGISHGRTAAADGGPSLFFSFCQFWPMVIQNRIHRATDIQQKGFHSIDKSELKMEQ